MSRNHVITQSHKHVPFLPERVKIESIKAGHMILGPKSISTQAREMIKRKIFQGKILDSHFFN